MNWYLITDTVPQVRYLPLHGIWLATVHSTVDMGEFFVVRSICSVDPVFLRMKLLQRLKPYCMLMIL